MNTPENPPAGLSRRDFLARASLGAMAAGVLPAALAQSATMAPATPFPALPKPAGPSPIALLEKVYFEKYTPEETAQNCDEIGLDLELTVRKDGHVKPEHAPDELPPIVAALAKRNRRVLFVALDTVRPDEPYWPEVLRVSKKLGITQYRHRGFKYEAGKPLKPQIANFNSMAREFAAANKEIGVQALYQTHSGREMAGGAVWDLDQILDGIDPQYFGVAFDTKHVLVEQGYSWPNALQLIAPRIAALCVKSYRWEGDKSPSVPLRTGLVKATVVQQVIAACGHVPICIHNEYTPFRPIPFNDRAEVVAAFRDDAEVLRGWLGMA
jgi:hypothetical protein